jgi:hypothetical protein
MADKGHILGAVACSETAEVVMEDDIEAPVQSIFDHPMPAYWTCNGFAPVT